MNNTVDPSLRETLVRWRHELHRCPETGFEEIRTSAYVTDILQAAGLEVTRGIGGTGLVASLICGKGPAVIGLRADMDAVNVTEAASDRPRASHHHGKMHADMMGTWPCCWARHISYARRAISTARSGLFFSPLRNMVAARRP